MIYYDTSRYEQGKKADLFVLIIMMMMVIFLSHTPRLIAVFLVRAWMPRERDRERERERERESVCVCCCVISETHPSTLGAGGIGNSCGWYSACETYC